MISDVIITNIIASGLLVLLVYLLDLNEKEPPWTLVKIYVLSILFTFLFGKLKSILFSHYGWEFPELINHYLIAGFAEELLKFIVVILFVWRLKSFNEEIDGVVYYLVVAAGFTVLENVGYSFRFVIDPYLYGLETGEMMPYQDALQRIVMLRMFSGHIFINVTTGVFLGFARQRHRSWLLIPGFITAVLIHGTWNLAAVNGFLGWFALGILVLNISVFMWTIRKSFYYKVMLRLKNRLRSLIREAKAQQINPDTIVLLEGIGRNLSCLRRFEGTKLKQTIREMIVSLPRRIQSENEEDEQKLIEKIVHANGLIGVECAKDRRIFFVSMFVRFAVPGFLILIILMNFM
ncbi:PrsW family intramembrane metalloprotease [candidate division KSB1 bacterium]|nr:PrsW family intramembrane metalloprotease [candidate division KSB1 bacterium]